MEKISEITRQKILFWVVKKGEYWYPGLLDEVSFLNRLYPLQRLRSSSPQFKNAGEEFIHHMTHHSEPYAPSCFIIVRAFQDPIFGLRDGDDNIFLDFICEVFHPAVRNERQNWWALLHKINQLLGNDGYEIYENGYESNRSLYDWRLLQADNSIIREQSENIVKIINTASVRYDFKIMNNLINFYPADAIDKAKKLLEICSRYILDDLGVSYDKNDSLLKLVKSACKGINLISENEAKYTNEDKITLKILSGLSSLVSGPVELRAEFGAVHGKKSNFKQLASCHAHLTVGAAIAVANFMLNTYIERKSSDNK